MSTTDTRAAFEAWAIKENYAFYSESERSVLFYGVSGTRNAIQKAWEAGMAQAATEAAKPAQEEDSQIRWCADGQIFGRPTATDALEYAEQRLRDPEEMSCCKSDVRLDAMLNVRELLSAAKATGTAGEIDAYAEMAKVKRDVELIGVGFLVDGKRCSLDRITWFNRPGDTWLPPPPGYPVQEALQPMTMSYVQNVPDQCDRITWRGAYYHLKEGAEAARQPSPVDQPIGPISDWTLPRLYDLACRQRHEIRESDKCIKRYADELVAARQPAPVSIKTWQERAEGKVLPEIRRFITDAVWAEQNYMEMLAEIADLRAALATRSQP